MYETRIDNYQREGRYNEAFELLIKYAKYLIKQDKPTHGIDEFNEFAVDRLNNSQKAKFYQTKSDLYRAAKYKIEADQFLEKSKLYQK